VTLTPADFQNATAAALRESVSRWGNVKPFVDTKQSEARSLARGAGLLVTLAEAGSYPSADKPGAAQPAAVGELAAAIQRGESWSSALSRAHLADPASKSWTLTHYAQARNKVATTRGSIHNVPNEEFWAPFTKSAQFWNPRTWNPPISGDWWLVQYFPHPPGHIIAAAQASEAGARAALKSEAEPQGVRDLRNFAAGGTSFLGIQVGGGRPIDLPTARTAWAKAQGLSDSEAKTLGGTMPTTTPITTLVPRTALLSSLAALRRAEPVQHVNSDRLRQIASMYRPLATTTTAYSGTVPSGTTAGTTEGASMGYPSTGVAVGGLAGVLVGGLIGKMVLGSWTGAAIGAGAGGLAGAGAGYALGGP